MRFLKPARALGTAWQFRMRTPAALIGRVDPATGKPFGNEIKRGLGTTHLPTARKRRDTVLGRIRELERVTVEGRSLRASASLGALVDEADMWADAVAAQDAAGGPDEDPDGQPLGDVREIARDRLERLEMLPPSKRPADAAMESAKRRALGRGMTLAKAVEGYVEARAVGNRGGFKPLARTSVLGVETAVRLLVECIGRPAEEIRLADVTGDEAHRFVRVWLPARVSTRAPNGLAAKSVEKHATLLAGLWSWAVEMRHATGNPWRMERHVPRAAKRSRRGGDDDEGRRPFTAEEAGKVLVGLPRGDRLGDLFRVALVVGCRADEIAQLRADDVDEDGGGFRVRAGKTDNARRWVPVPVIAREIVKGRREAAVAQRLSSDASALREDRERLFWEFPVRAASGKAAAVSQAFTRERRRLLGTGTDGALALHSTRHTWRTEARRARVPEDVVDEIGGWAGPGRSSDPYNHGMRRGQLRKAQERVAAAMVKAGLLAGF